MLPVSAQNEALLNAPTLTRRGKMLCNIPPLPILKKQTGVPFLMTPSRSRTNSTTASTPTTPKPTAMTKPTSVRPFHFPPRVASVDDRPAEPVPGTSSSSFLDFASSSTRNQVYSFFEISTGAWTPSSSSISTFSTSISSLVIESTQQNSLLSVIAQLARDNLFAEKLRRAEEERERKLREEREKKEREERERKERKEGERKEKAELERRRILLAALVRCPHKVKWDKFAEEWERETKELVEEEKKMEKEGITITTVLEAPCHSDIRSKCSSLPPPTPIPTSVAPPPSTSTAPRSQSPTTLTNKRPPKATPTAPNAALYAAPPPPPAPYNPPPKSAPTGPQVYRLMSGFSGATPPTGPRALVGNLSTPRPFSSCTGPALHASTSTLPPSVPRPPPHAPPPPQPPPPTNSSPRPVSPPTSKVKDADASRLRPVECVRSTPSTGCAKASTRPHAINTTGITATRNTSMSNTPNSSTPVTPTATPTPTSIPPSAGLPPHPPVAVTTPVHHLHRDPLSSMMAMGMGISNSSSSSSAKRLGNDRVKYERDGERSQSKEKVREKDWDHWAPRPRRDWDSWPCRMTDKY
ncbi:hypothetical protein Agabi119p4_8933 [Agaricus bisporus var. burnettii]|uniref:Uncharacterized protein n=1 Tax=Agaricus bisporus var. burnettii TaxID=192524 RepID=A0A8H7EY62_AGABI|nr:hypothetical protein Agabi119p4_8933 [Agaricus bisporus var. burnettii]